MNLNGKTFNPGQLRTSIVLKSRGVSTETGGFQTPTWATIATVWAKWQNVHGAEVWAAESANAVRPATVTLRYRPDVDETCAVELDGALYEIVSIDDIENRHEYLELKVQRMRSG
jgi:SPP1 family predicted phage head-tail adaptor